MPTYCAGTCTSARIVHERSHLAKVHLCKTQLAAKARVSRRWLSDLEAGKERAELGLVIRTVHALSMIVDLQPEENTGQINLDDFLDQRRARPRMPIAADSQNSDPDRGGDNGPTTDRR